MENIHNFDEEKLTTKKSSKKLLVILTVIVVIVAILVLGFCNFTDKYGVIPTNEKLSSGDKIPYVIMLEGVPEDIHYEKEVGEISLSYSKTVFDMPADVTAFFGGGCRLTGFVYTFDGIDESNQNEIYQKITANIESTLDNSFSCEADVQNQRTVWTYSEGAKSECIELYTDGNNAHVVINFQY